MAFEDGLVQAKANVRMCSAAPEATTTHRGVHPHGAELVPSGGERLDGRVADNFAVVHSDRRKAVRPERVELVGALREKRRHRCAVHDDAGRRGGTGDDGEKGANLMVIHV